MQYWSPTMNEIKTWSPPGGWNSTFSNTDKIQCTNLYFFFKDKKGFKENIATNLAQMVVYKKKYNGLKYSDDQEEILINAMKTVFHK